MLKGSCLCGAIRYEIDAPVNAISHCHCGQCRKAHGAPFGSYFSVPKQALRFVQGADQVRTYGSSPGIARTFCPHCGSTLQWMKVDSDTTCMTPGTLDSPLGEVAQTHIYTEWKADWYALTDGLPVEPHS
ncbi:GFA family protein [Pseudomonas mangiferae]|uniref:GFA family protein n=1 Tax=Pseudomonas mangiferae TaxID=2593654 RepID=A0A553GUQ0_9PSED|nr:GFA family protein [Pseudomonas mangiferae]TRX73176.1 GFA family protein [Pseudomonas mangiferae]